MAGYIGSKASVVSSGAEHKKTFTITGATTSLTGLNYTVGKVHVFQNGVRLVDGTDYTATNGTTITLTVAAQSGDNVVVISQASFQVADALLTSGGTMTGDLTVQGAFTSKGIDDNSNATAITITSAEHVLIGKTSTSSGVAGVRFAGDSAGYAEFTRDGGNPLFLNRETSDGYILRFAKDNSYVGSIGTDSSGDFVIDGSANHSGLRFKDNTIVPKQNGSDADNAIDLGKSDKRWKDLYLSGGVYLGGTVAANKLDDYETGSFYPSFEQSGATITMSSLLGFYTKIGRMVHCSGRLTTSGWSGGSGTIYIGSLPFTSKSGLDCHTASVGPTFSGWSNVNAPSFGFMVGSDNRIALFANDTSDARSQKDTNVTLSGDGSVGIIFNVTYTT